jgi:hypothetical protein
MNLKIHSNDKLHFVHDRFYFYVDSCRPGTYSSTGVEPCSPCAIGGYQSSVGTSSCLKCDKGKFTQTIGSSSEVDCTGNNDCSILKVQKLVHNKQYNISYHELSKPTYPCDASPDFHLGRVKLFVISQMMSNQNKYSSWHENV